MIGTSDQSCWLAEACKILLLVLLQRSYQSFSSNDLSVYIKYMRWLDQNKEQN